MSYLSHARPVNIPAPPGGRTRSPPSPARSPYVHSARDGGTPPSAWSQEWSDAPRPRSSASRYSSGSDLLFPMDSERGSGSSAGSSRHGSAEPPFMYSVPQSPSYTNGAVRYPTCSECGRPYYGPAPAPGSPSRGRSRRTDTALCPACHPTTWQPQQVQAVRRSSQRGFSPHTPYRSRMDSPPRSSGTYRQLRTPRTTEPPTPRAPPTHVIGRAFPSFRPAVQQWPSESAYMSSHTGRWTDPGTLPPCTPVVGAYHTPSQLPQLIRQVQQRPGPTSGVYRADDHFGAASAPTFSSLRRGQ